jgi:asparagine N-glycosylation enzyme membrane subunit Stt3
VAFYFLLVIGYPDAPSLDGVRAILSIIFKHMLVTIAIVLLVLWLLGIIGVYSIGWFIHVLLVVAIILFLIRVIQGRNPLA